MSFRKPSHLTKDTSNRAASARKGLDASFLLLADSVSDLIVVVADDGNIEYLNHRSAEFLGGEAEAMIGRNLRDIIHEEDQVVCTKLWETLRLPKESFQAPVRLRDLRGDYHWVQFTAKTLTSNEKARSEKWLLTVLPVEDAAHPSKKLDIERLADERRYQTLFESIDQGFCIVEMIFDAHQKPVDYRIVEGNAAYSKLTGLRDTGRQTIRELLPDLEFWWVETYGRIALSREPERFEYYASPMRRWFEVYAFPISEPHTYQVAILFKDITDRRKTDTAIQEYRRRLETALIAGEVGSFEWDIEQDRVWGDKNFSRIFGVMPDADGDAPLEAYMSAIHPDDRDNVSGLLAQAIRTGGVYQAEYRVAHEGGERWVVARGKVEYEEDGKVRRFPGIVLDVTERKRAELQLRESQERFRELANAMPQLVWTADADGTVTYYNSQAQRYQGIARDENEMWQWQPVLHPDDRVRTLAAWHEAIATGNVYECEHRVRMADSSFRWHLSRAFKVQGADCARWYGTATDIHELKLAEQAMRESEERFRTLADNMSQLAWMADNAGQIFWYNQRWLDYIGITLDAMIDLGWRAVHHPDFVDTVAAKFEQCVHAGLDWEDTFPLKGRDGNYRWFLSRAVPIRNSAGEITRWFGTNTDVTEFRRIEAELRRAQELAEVANKSKSDFLANMSHEIRSPMTAILGYADLLSTNNAADHEKIETIRRNGQYLLTLINDILDLSKIEAGKLELELIEFSPRKLVEEVFALMQVRASESGLQFQQLFASMIPKVVSSDPIRIRQILINLVGNAIKFTESGSVRVVVSYHPAPSELKIDVIDTGIGMDEEELSRLFKPFSQVDATISRRFGGSGLGLAISHRLANLLNGRIEVESQIGKGSRFSLVVPVPAGVELEAIPAGSQKLNSEAPAKQLTSGQLVIRVLVVDDRRDVRFLVQSFVQKVGGETTLCENGAEAIERIHAEHAQGRDFDVVLMDMQMPVMDGLTAVRQLRTEGYDRPIIALTANAMSTDRQQCIEAGYNDHLSKPVDVQRLIEILRRYTSQ